MKKKSRKKCEKGEGNDAILPSFLSLQSLKEMGWDSYSDLQRYTTCQVDTTLWDELYM